MQGLKENDVSVTNISCRRCGTCCRKGGPGLHAEDAGLIEQGVVSCEDIVCFRKGELAYDQARGRLEPLKSELLKLRGKEGTWECLFYDPGSKGCRIYAARPLECRTLMCWDTKPLEKIMTDDDRLQRRDLVPQGSGLAALIADHEGHCALEKVVRLVGSDALKYRDGRAEIMDICLYDRRFREALEEKIEAAGPVLECYFGRPLFKAIRGYDPWFESEDFLRYFS